VLGQQDDLAHVLAVVDELAVDGVHDGVGLAADEDGPAEVLRLQRVEGGEEALPAVLPPLHELRPGRAGRGLELAVAVAVGLLAVGREEIRPARAHVAGDVLDEDGHAVGPGVQAGHDVRIVETAQGPLAERLQGRDAGARAAQEIGADVRAAHRGGPASHSPSKSTSTSPT
jgi:hypothetical protein